MRKRADIVLVERGFFSSRARAQAAIAAGLVSVGGVALKKSSEEVAGDAPIEAGTPHPWASRGGVKLAAALDAFALDPAGLICLDIGASTGGTESLRVVLEALPASWRHTRSSVPGCPHLPCLTWSRCPEGTEVPRRSFVNSSWRVF